MPAITNVQSVYYDVVDDAIASHKQKKMVVGEICIYITCWLARISKHLRDVDDKDVRLRNLTKNKFEGSRVMFGFVCEKSTKAGLVIYSNTHFMLTC